jgi:protein-S-isoprenylcysteine O-methyltransferase Ste14
VWVVLAVVAVTNIPLTQFITKTPRLLAARTKAGPRAEKRPSQKLIMGLIGLSSVATYIVAGLDHQFHWSNVPPWLAITGDLLVALGMGMVYWVFKENVFASATVEIATDQKVITTGPYAIVRHPMYASVTVYVIGMPLALASYWGLLASILTVLGLVWRVFDEEGMLASGLPGYREYCASVRWRLVPGAF